MMKIRIFSIGTYNPATQTTTWTQPTLAIDSIGYVDDVLTHDGRLVFINRVTQTLFFSPLPGFYSFTGTQKSSSLIDYPLGSFIKNNSPISRYTINFGRWC